MQRACQFSAPGLLMSVLFAVPLEQCDGWRFVHYRHIPPNEFRCSSEGLEITVKASAAAAVYPLTKQVKVRAIRAVGTVMGNIHLPAAKQGKKNFDDYTLRIGLVESGTRNLSYTERKAAPGWARKLFSLAPKGTGIARIHFFNLGTDSAQIGRQRVHPVSDLIHEHVVAVPQPDGRFDVTHPLDQDVPTIAIWIACDGDDTQSAFKVTLERLELELAPGEMAFPLRLTQ